MKDWIAVRNEQVIKKYTQARFNQFFACNNVVTKPFKATALPIGAIVGTFLVPGLGTVVGVAVGSAVYLTASNSDVIKRKVVPKIKRLKPNFRVK